MTDKPLTDKAIEAATQTLAPIIANWQQLMLSQLLRRIVEKNRDNAIASMCYAGGTTCQLPHFYTLRGAIQVYDSLLNLNTDFFLDDALRDPTWREHLLCEFKEGHHE